MVGVVNFSMELRVCMLIVYPVVKVKGGESERFRIDMGMGQSIIIPCLFNVYMDAMLKEAKTRIGRVGPRFLGEGREWRLPRL